MAAYTYALLGLCLALIAHGTPIRVKIAPPPRVDRVKSAPQGVNPQLQGGGFEGDMIFPKSSTRGVAIFGNNPWPGNVIPFDISAITDPNDQQMIYNSMMMLMYSVATPIEGTDERAACVYFRPREESDTTYFKLQYGNGCSAPVGYWPGYISPLTLQKNGCFYYGTIQHELMHVLGFYHEQSRPDRDEHLEIHLENVEPDMRHNFNKYEWGSTVVDQGTPYDYSSVMHYETTAFSTNGLPTMVPRQTGAHIGRAQQLSDIDIAEVRNRYGCPAY